MFKFIFKTLFDQRKMNDSTLDLLSEKSDEEFADEFAMEVERKAAELEITVDYYMMECM